MKAEFRYWAVVLLNIAVFLTVLAGCSSSTSMPNTSPLPEIDASTVTTVILSSPGNATAIRSAWNLDYATIKYDKQGKQLWVARYNGPGTAHDRGNAIATDDEGNVYVTGESIGSGNGTQYDYATVKYDKNGKEVWARRYVGPGSSYSTAKAIAVDQAGNVFVTGRSATIKYDRDGNEQWVNPISGEAQALALDSAGNVLVVGNSSNAAFLAKYDTNGKVLWTASYPNYSSAYAMALDVAANVYIAGFTRGNSTDYLTVKYDVNGNQLWMASYDGPGNYDDVAYGIGVDAYGDVFLTGRSTGINTTYDCATIKYDNDGKQVWVARYAGSARGEDIGNKLAVDAEGNVLVAGYSSSSNGRRELMTIKYDSDGRQVWASQYNAAGSNDGMAWALAVNSDGEVTVAGRSGDWGSQGANYSYATVKYDRNGRQLWAASYHGPGSGSEGAQAVAVDADGNTYVTGTSAGNQGIPQMTQPPWSDVHVYDNPDQTVRSRVGEEFAFGFETAPRLGMTWAENHDLQMLSLVDNQMILKQPMPEFGGKAWFLFEALQAGRTQITFTYSHGVGFPTVDQKIFHVTVE